ncbi:MAG: FAD-dependent oxidoreductase [Candidatus Electryonea clarkiae]|nr:FAD-dependent oxidoreductase [Candidatus Electryonea clarkiae]MDP8286114.1 FAD-dependent oxidoreductase [Candidatus Electryonea clarkiae]
MLPGEKKYPHIFSPVKIGNVWAKNRIKYASTETNYNYSDGFVSEKELAYIDAHARGGSGIVTTQGAYTDPKGEGQGYAGMMGIWDDKYIPGLKRMADIIHQNDARACLQLMHCGRVGGINLKYTVGPSAVPQRLRRFRPQREMTVEDIEICIQEHIDGAIRAVEAGYEIIEVSGIVGYLISNYVSSYTNKRTDEYGGDIFDRSTFMRKIVEGIREACDDSVAIGIRLCGWEMLDDRGGNKETESLESIKIAETAGCDYLSVTVGWQESLGSVISRDIPMGKWLYVAERTKKALNIPVMMAYRLFTPELPEKAIAEGKLDIWEMCRPQIADPALPNKIMWDRQEDIIPCIACQVCLARLFRDAPVTCTVRPSCSHEGEREWGYYGFPKTEIKRKIFIAGAGLAGLQAAAIAAEKGHDVTVYEKSDHIGGQWYFASRNPWGEDSDNYWDDEELMRWVDYIKAQCDKHGAKFVLNTPVTKELLDAEKPDSLVIATGAAPEVPDIPGIDKPHVVKMSDVFTGQAKLGKNVVIMGGSGGAISLALYVIGKMEKDGVEDYTLSMIGPESRFGLDVNPSYIWRYRLRLKSANVQQLTNGIVKKITDDSITASWSIFDRKTKTKEKFTDQVVPADTIILATLVPNKDLSFGSYKGDVSKIGDSLSVRRGIDAIQDGYRLGMRF